MRALERYFGRGSDVAIVALVLGILLVLFVPIPSAAVDFLILTNFSLAVLILLLTFYVNKPVEFSTFPSILLIATLFRLAINVATTRLILSDGDAGRVIGAVGSYVVGGNYIIGLIVFLILVVVQYVVVTNGAQRVSEVAARFTLDSMPGQQMSIDADLNMGFIDQNEAQRRRKNIEKEAGFYGAMDGASKFVKGDAVAGIIILLINIVGGITIGVMQHGMPWGQAVQTYTLLTIGDGIVTQVPALIISVATGIIVTRSSSDGSLSGEAVRQISHFPKALILVGMVLSALLFLPGLPYGPALILTVIFAMAGFAALRANAVEHSEDSSSSKPGFAGVNEASSSLTEDPYAVLAVEPIEVHAGSHWIEATSKANNVISERIALFRRQHALDFGLIVPLVKFKSNLRLAADKYEIHLDGVIAGRGEVFATKTLAIHPSGNTGLIPGDVTRDPTYGLPALWIEDHQRSEATQAGFTLVDGISVFMTHLTEVIRRESAVLLTRSETEKILNRVRQHNAGLVEEIIPTVLQVIDVQRVLQGLLKEKVSIRNIEAILECLADLGRQSKDVTVLIEGVRVRLGHAICQGLVADSGVLHVITLAPDLEGKFISAIHTVHANIKDEKSVVSAPASLSMDPKISELLVTRLVAVSEKMMKNNLLPVLLCSPDVRRHMRILSERVLPHLRVLSMAEIPRSVELKSFGVVTL